jgi:hypothetical protein
MPAVIETGAGVTGANCYGVTDIAATMAAARAYATLRGVVLSADDPTLTAQLVKATDYIESLQAQFVGLPALTTQGLSWPRKNVVNSDGSSFPSNALPTALLNALYQLCIEQFNGVILMPTTDPSTSGGFVISEKIDVIETHYSERVGVTRAPIMPQVDGWIAKISTNQGAMSLRV